jgi:hypothetical protein
VHRAELTHLLRRRREALQTRELQSPRGRRALTGGLRREEVAALRSISTDKWSRIDLPARRIRHATAHLSRGTSHPGLPRILGHIPVPRQATFARQGPGVATGRTLPVAALGSAPEESRRSSSSTRSLILKVTKTSVPLGHRGPIRLTRLAASAILPGELLSTGAGGRIIFTDSGKDSSRGQILVTVIC